MNNKPQMITNNYILYMFICVICLISKRRSSLGQVL